MKTRKPILRMTSVILCLCMLATLFSGCGGKNEEESNTLDVQPIVFDKSGNLQAVIAMKNAKKVKADEVTISYTYVDGENIPEDAGDDFDVNSIAQVQNLKPTSLEQEDGVCIVSFTDDMLLDCLPLAYTVTVGELSGEAQMRYPEQTATPDVESVPYTAKELTVNLTADGASFKDTVDAGQFEMDGSFAGMQVTGAQRAGDGVELTMSGTIQADTEAGAFLDGLILVAPEAFEDGLFVVNASIPVTTPALRVVPEGSRMTEAGFILPIALEACTFATNVNVNDFSLEGKPEISVLSVEQKGDDKAEICLSANTQNADEAVRAVQDGILTIKGEATTYGSALDTRIDLPFASLQAKFDYFEEKDSRFFFTLELNAVAGALHALTADRLSFSGDFEGAEDISLDGTTLKFSVPANGDAENYRVDGVITAAADTLENAWGTLNTAETSYSRIYMPENLGKGKIMDALGKVSGIYAKYGSYITTGISAISGGIGIGVKIAELFGWKESIDSKLDEVNDQLRAVNDKLDTLQSDVTAISEQITEFRETYEKDKIQEAVSKRVQDFDKLLNGCFYRYNKLFDDIEEQVYRVLAGEGAEDKTAADGIGIPQEVRQAVREKGRSVALNEWLSIVPEATGASLEITDRQLQLVQFEATRRVVSRLGADTDKYLEDYIQLCKALAGKTLAGSYDITKSALADFDTYISYSYNFGTFTWPARVLYRTTIADTLNKGCEAVAVVETYKNYAAADTYDSVPDYYGTAVDQAKAYCTGAAEALDALFIDIEHEKVYKETRHSYSRRFYTISEDEIHEYKPIYSYVMNCYVSSMPKSVMFNEHGWGLPADSSATIEWIRRMTHATMKEELEEAGFLDIKYYKYLLTNCIPGTDKSHYSVQFLDLNMQNPKIQTENVEMYWKGGQGGFLTNRCNIRGPETIIFTESTEVYTKDVVLSSVQEPREKYGEVW